MSANAQTELCLPPRATDDTLAEKLASHVEQFNASIDPVERTELHAAIVRVRSLLETRGAR